MVLKTLHYGVCSVIFAECKEGNETLLLTFFYPFTLSLVYWLEHHYIILAKQVFDFTILLRIKCQEMLKHGRCCH